MAAEANEQRNVVLRVFALKPDSWSNQSVRDSGTIRPLYGGRFDEEVKVY